VNLFFCSDLHLGHFNIIRYTNRPFKTLEEMDSVIIARFNERVKEDDLCYFLGDFCFRYAPKESPNAPKNAFEFYRNQLKCKNIIFIKGSHDKNNGIKTPIESMIINYGGNRIYLTHDPKYAKENYSLNLTGHCHGKYGKFRKLGEKSVIVDLSVENWDYYPVTINEIFQAFSKWKKEGCKNEK